MSSLPHLFRRISSRISLPHTSAALKELAAHATVVRVGEASVSVETVFTRAAIDTGLSGRTEPGCMLFLFDHDAQFKFWMRGMQFSLDIIWISADMKVVDISASLPPLPDESPAVFYSPNVPARFVLEVPAGWCAEKGITVGDAVEFSTGSATLDSTTRTEDSHTSL